MMLLWLSYSYNCNSASLLAMGRVDALCLCVYWFDSLGLRLPGRWGLEDVEGNIFIS